MVRVRVWFRVSVRNRLGGQFSSGAIVLEPYFFNGSKEHPLKISNERTRISLLIKLFLSLIELKTSNKRIHV